MGYIGSKPANKVITASDLEDDIITSAKIADGVIVAGDLAANSVDSSELIDGSIDTSHLGALQVTTAKLAADAIDGTKLADNAVDSEHYTDGSIDTAHIDALQVTTAKIAADAIDGTKLADDAVESEHMAAGSVDNAHLAGSIATSKIGSGTFADARISLSSVTQHVTAFDDTDLRSDIITLALKEAITENRVAYNLPNSMIEQFQDDSKLGTETDGDRNASEYWDTVAAGSIDSATKLLIHSDTTDGSTTFVDSSAGAHTDTVAGDIHHETDQAKFGASSIHFDGNATDYLTYPDSADWYWASGPFTFDVWVYITDLTDRNFLWGIGNGVGNELLYCEVNTAGEFRIAEYLGISGGGWSDGFSVTGTGATVSINEWTHLALVVDGTTSSDWYLFKNGVELGKTLAQGGYDQPFKNFTEVLYIGRGDYQTTGVLGYMDEFRISKSARWTSNFTPSTVPYGSDVVSATGTLISTAQTANSAQTKVSGVILYKNQAGTATLGTDLKIYFTCNGGTNWTESTPTAAGTFSSGILMAKCPEVTCTSGTDVRYKAVWANQATGKQTQLHGIGMNY